MADISMRARWARRLIRKKISEELNAIQAGGTKKRLGDEFLGIPIDPIEGSQWTIDKLPSAPSIPQDSHPGQQLRVCIIGAGMAGLRTAMLLEKLKIKHPGISYEILEASDRTGGRVYTHYFSQAKHDYYDIGAMRFPQIPTMKPVFNLFKEFDLPAIPYFLSAERNPSNFNDILKYDPPDGGVDTFKVSVANKGMVPDKYVNMGPSHIVSGVFEPYKKALRDNFKKGFELLMKEDKYTTRSYLRERTEYSDFFTIQWLETFGSASGLYDQAFTESVIDSFDFDYSTDTKWFCIEGGTTLLARAMENSLSQKVELSKTVTGITLDRSRDVPQMLVQVGGEEKARKYDTVFCTTTLACMQRMDLRGAELNPSQKDAIRALHYDTSCKVAIKFSNPWWITKYQIKSGGAGSTDLPLRTCVYPSYNLHDGPDKEAVLLCSYTWAQDAQRISSLVSPSSPSGEDELKDLMFRDLARLHAPDEEFQEVYEYIKSCYVDHHAFAWYQDPYTSGAFALFGPGQFENFYPLLSRPAADARLHFVGEATSTHHAWIIGALDSAKRAITYFRKRFGLHDDMGHLEDSAEVPAEVEDGPNGTAHLQIMLGMQKPGEHVTV